MLLTLEAIFENPVRADIRWKDVESLLGACGVEFPEGRGARVRVALAGIRNLSLPAPPQGDRPRRNTIEHKGYAATVWFDDQADTFHGEVLNIRDVVTFQGRTVKELRQALRDSVDDYLEFCAQRGEEPDRPFSGRFVVRANPELHRRVALAAAKEGKSLNAWVLERLSQ